MDSLRSLPSVDRLIEHEALERARARWARRVVLAVVRQELDAARAAIRAGKSAAGLEGLARRAAERLAALETPGPRRMINATGVVVHTNLGRARLGAEAARRIAEVATGYSDLEFDNLSGKRGSRQAHVAPWLELLFPGRGVHAVNNNAAAVMLGLNTLARGKGVVISRGELVEIGGSFRVPEILERSGARLVEVGTTNRTHRHDYARALEAEAGEIGAVLKVWPSNYRVVGFTKEVPTRELAALAREHGVPLIADQGCGRLFRDAPGPESEVSVEELLEEGADLVTFSGDKMLGGPQAGILVGDPTIVAACAQNPLARALRLGKLTIAALSETVRAWLSAEGGGEGLPVAAMLARPLEELDADARALAARIEELVAARMTPGEGEAPRVEVISGSSRVGGGAAPEEELPTRLVVLRWPGRDEEKLLRALRRHEVPVVARIVEGALAFDPRTLAPDEREIVARAVAELAGAGGG